jgi:hypothetical protein
VGGSEKLTQKMRKRNETNEGEFCYGGRSKEIYGAVYI